MVGISMSAQSTLSIGDKKALNFPMDRHSVHVHL